AEVFGDLGVALVGHGNAADRARHESLAHLADLRALQVVDLVADLFERGGDHGQKVHELNLRVPRRDPGDVGRAQSQLGQEYLLKLEAALAIRRQRTDSAGQLPLTHAPGDIFQ